MSVRDQFNQKLAARSPYSSRFWLNEQQQYNPFWGPLHDRMWSIENEQTPPPSPMDNFYRNERQQRDPNYPVPDPAMDREMQFLKEGQNRTFDDSRAYQVAQANTGIMSDAMPSYADRAREAGLDLNVTQAQRSGQALRLLQAESILRDLEGQGTRTGQRALEMLPNTIENLLIDEDYGRFIQARDAFAEAAMRADTGATINESEWPRIIRNLMPQPGDGPERLAQRRAMREVFIQSLMASSGEAGAIMPKVGEPVVPVETADPSSMSNEELLKALGQ